MFSHGFLKDRRDHGNGSMDLENKPFKNFRLLCSLDVEIHHEMVDRLAKRQTSC